jgi:hypothetical protein
MTSILRCLTAVIIATTSRIALAHPGHGVTDPDSVAHQIVEPVHAVPWILLVGISVALIVTGGLMWKQQRNRRHAVAAASDRRRSTAERN